MLILIAHKMVGRKKNNNNELTRQLGQINSTGLFPNVGAEDFGVAFKLGEFFFGAAEGIDILLHNIWNMKIQRENREREREKEREKDKEREREIKKEIERG